MAMAEAAHGHGHAMVLAPTMVEFMETCWSREPLKMGFVQGSGLLCALVTVWICAQHWRALRKAPHSLRRGLYVQVAMLPAVLVIVSLLVLLCPSASHFLRMVQKTYEGLILHKFGVLMFMLVLAESDLRRSSSDNVHDQNCVEILQETLAEDGPKKHFAALPLGCCFRPCLSEHNLSAGQLSFVYWLIQQFVLLMPIISVVQVYLFTVVEMRTWALFRKWTDVLVGASNLFCIYGLVILFLATKNLLRAWKTKRKFVAIKVVLVIAIWQHFAIEAIVARFTGGPGSDSCFQYAGWAAVLRDQTDWWRLVEKNFFDAWISTMEAVPMALMMRWAFRAEELQISLREIHQDVLELGLRGARIAEPRAFSAEDSTRKVPTASSPGEDTRETNLSGSSSSSEAQPAAERRAHLDAEAAEAGAGALP